LAGGLCLGTPEGEGGGGGGGKGGGTAAGPPRGSRLCGCFAFTATEGEEGRKGGEKKKREKKDSPSRPDYFAHGGERER